MRSVRGYIFLGVVILLAVGMLAWTASARLLPDAGTDADVDVPPGYQLFKVQNKGGKQADLEHFNWVGILPAIPSRNKPVDFHIDAKVHVDDGGSASASTHTRAQENWH